jgi:hypothetical protein
MSYKVQSTPGGALVLLTVPNPNDEEEIVLHGISLSTARRLYQELGEALLESGKKRDMINVSREMQNGQRV